MKKGKDIMKIKQRPMKRTISYAVMPMFAYFGIDFLVTLIYVFLVAMPKLSDAIALNASITQDDMMLIYNDILASDAVKLMCAVNAGVLVYAVRSFMIREGQAFDKRYENRICLKDVLMLAVMAAGLYFAVSVVLTIITPLFSMIDDSMQQLNETVNVFVSTDMLLSVFVVGVLAPIMEEFLVRGLVFNRLRKIGSVPFAIFTSAMIFSVMHLPMVGQAVYTFAVGAVFAWAYYKYENILVPIILHILYNMCSFMYVIEPLNTFFSTIAGMLVFYALGVGLTFFGCKYIKEKKRPELREEYAQIARTEEINEESEDKGGFGM